MNITNEVNGMGKFLLCIWVKRMYIDDVYK